MFKLGLVLASVLAKLPYKSLLALGRLLGRCVLPFAKRRRHITEVNLKLCFPDLSDKQRNTLLKKSFESAGMAAFETVIAWFFSKKQMQQINFVVHGLDNYEKAKASGKGVLITGSHFTCLELIGRLFYQIEPDYAIVYQRHKDDFFNQFIIDKRLKYSGSCIQRQDLRAMLRHLRSGGKLWYAPDQDLGARPSVFVPFFGVQTATLTATARLTKGGKALCVPVFFNRLHDYSGYELRFLPALENFPSGDDEKDARTYNELLEKYILKHPEQYLWQHRRFKTRPEGESDVY